MFLNATNDPPSQRHLSNFLGFSSLSDHRLLFNSELILTVQLSSQALSNCLPISIGTIAGNSNGVATSSASVITSPQAFEQTLQSQEADIALDSHRFFNGTIQQQVSFVL